MTISRTPHDDAMVHLAEMGHDPSWLGPLPHTGEGVLGLVRHLSVNVNVRSTNQQFARARYYFWCHAPQHNSKQQAQHQPKCSDCLTTCTDNPDIHVNSDPDLNPNIDLNPNPNYDNLHHSTLILAPPLSLTLTLTLTLTPIAISSKLFYLVNHLDLASTEP